MRAVTREDFPGNDGQWRNSVERRLAALAGGRALTVVDDGGGTAAGREDSTPVTATVGANSNTTTAVVLAKSFRLLSMTVDAACRVRLFATAAGAAADLGRPATDDPPDGRGVILDYVTTFGGTYLLSPLVDGSSMETIPSSSITTVIDNPTGSSADITVSFDYLPTE